MSQNFTHLARRLGFSKTVNLVATVVIVVAIPLTVLLAQQVQNLTQRAQMVENNVIEPESGTVTDVTIGDDSEASGGKYLLFGALPNTPGVSATTAPSITQPASTVTPPVGYLPAFPGAEGFGAKSVGGRFTGTRVIEVTNLNDSGTGSLRAAIDATGPRFVVFRIGGTITLNTALIVRNPYITIAGQTAPGGGITLRNNPTNTKGTFIVNTHDVIVRYIRSRPGKPSVSSNNVDAFGIEGTSASANPPFTGNPTYNVILDHCSASWANDENMETWYAVRDITIQWCIISEGLMAANHSEGPHSMGILLGEKLTSVSVHHNLVAHNRRRYPEAKSRDNGVIDYVNNLAYNYGGGIATVEDGDGHVKLNYVGNYVKRGPSSSTSTYEMNYIPETYDDGTVRGVSLYLKGNIGPHRLSDTDPETNVLDATDKADSRLRILSAPNATEPITTTTAQQAYEEVLAKAGARFPHLDSVDQRIINDVKNGTGALINDETVVGGWPVLAAGTPPVDTDHDGIPDSWESARGLNPDNAADAVTDRNGDGYLNIEEYINGLVE